MKSKLAVLPAILKCLELMPYLKALQNIFSYPKNRKLPWTDSTYSFTKFKTQYS